jgi:hypothetical protein
MGRLRLYTDDRGRLAMNHAGFSWLAALSLPVWALQHRLYALALAGYVLSNVINLALGTTAQAIAFTLQFFAFGVSANRLHRWHLERRGWRITAEENAPALPSSRATTQA